MSSVDFDEQASSFNKYKSRTVLGQPSTPGLVGFFMRTGLVKSEEGGMKMLYFILFFCILATAFSVYYFFGPAQKPLTPEQRIQRIQNDRSLTSEEKEGQINFIRFMSGQQK